MEKEKLLLKLDFELTNGKYIKKYNNNYQISIENFKVNYGDKIKVHRNNVLDLNSKNEYLVVLECINQLLKIGYNPEDIEIEKQYKFGRKFKSYSDVLVNKNNKTYLIIECKTSGNEYVRAKELTIKDGDQSFSYLRQEPDVKIVSLYTSKLKEDKIVRNYDFIRVKQGWNQLSHEDSYKDWDKSFEKKGLLEDNAKPYSTDKGNLTYNDLKNLNETEGGFIFNLFAEILRRNVISDKSNAFNKIFNLFICKIVDEDKKSANPNSDLDFQWKSDTDTTDVFLLRLEKLYARGLKDYLDVSTFNFKEDTDSIIVKLSNNFNFKDVYSEDTYLENFGVVKQVVQLLQEFQINYSSKHQYMGDFFESLLNHGIKQEAGQFFTPTVLARFICKSLPLEKLINNKNEKEEINFFPYVIDYSSGAGHFLTEMMDELNIHFSKFDEEKIQNGRRGKEEFISHKDNYLWAKEYIYGIEKDYRLAKTTKISSFLNGDGDANIFPGDGLDSFFKSKVYKKKLKIENENENQDNSNFDVIVANPPFGVKSFHEKLEFGEKDFTLFKFLTEKSKEIECLFIERTKQLISNYGVAGIIVPSSIFINSGPLFKATRKILFENFNLQSIVMLDTNAFAESTQTTCILFMSKKNEQLLMDESDYVKEFYPEIKNTKEFKNVLDTLEVNNLGIFSLYEDYDEFNKLTEKNKIEHIRKNENEKILCFNSIKNKEIIIVNTVLQDTKKTKRLLGYEFSKTRGKEGIKIYKNNGLFNKDDNFDKSKINYYILKKFENDNSYKKLNTEVKEYLKIKNLSDLIKFDTFDFEYKVILKEPVNIISEYDKIKIKNLNFHIKKGSSAPPNEYFVQGKHQFVRADNLNDIDEYGYIKKKSDDCLNDIALENFNLKKFKSGTILFPTSGQSINTNNIGILKYDSYVAQH